MSNQPLPVYDWRNREQPVFGWIIEQAQRVRAQRNTDALMAELRRRDQRARDNRPVQNHEAKR